MSKTRLEAFSDGVIAILITVMVLEFRTPEGATWEALQPLVPIFLTYVMSFVYLAIYWNNHHHLMHTVERINGNIMWANMHLLFWLSLVPFVTGWMGEAHLASMPTAAYGVVMLMAAVAYTILQAAVVDCQRPGSVLREAVEAGVKEKASLAAIAVSIPLAFVRPWVSAVLFVCVVLIWQLARLTLQSYRSEDVAPTLMATPLWIPQAVMPIGAAAVTISLLRSAIGNWRRVLAART